MRFFQCLTAISFVFLLETNSVIGLVDDVLDILHLTKEVASGVIKAWDIVEQTNLADHIELPITREKHKKVLRRLTELSRKIDRTESQYTSAASWTIETITEFMKTNGRLDHGLLQIDDIIHRISVRSKQMRTYTEHQRKLEDSTLISFAEWTVSPNADAIHHLLERLHLQFVGDSEARGGGGRNNGVLKMLSNNLEVNLLSSVIIGLYWTIQHKFQLKLNSKKNDFH